MPTTNAMSNYLENKVLVDNLTVGTRYIALFSVSPGDTNTGTEISGGSYARQVITFSVTGNQATNSGTEIIFPTATANWGSVAHFGIYDQATGGNLLFHGALENSQGVNFVYSVNSGDVMKFPVGSLAITLE